MKHSNVECDPRRFLNVLRGWGSLIKDLVRTFFAFLILVALSKLFVCNKLSIMFGCGKSKSCPKNTSVIKNVVVLYSFISSVRSSYSHPDLLLIHHPLFQITPVLNTGLSLSEPLQLYKGYNAI